jgi:hypothetical protein
MSNGLSKMKRVHAAAVKVVAQEKLFLPTKGLWQVCINTLLVVFSMIVHYRK